MAAKDTNVEDLTTDACPSPPRDEQGETISDNKNESYSHMKDNKKKDNKPKRKRGSTQGSTGTTQVSNVKISMNGCQGIHVGDIIKYKYNMGKSQKQDTSDEEEIPKTKEISELFQRNDPVTLEIISYVSKYIGANWRAAARMLEYSEGEIDQFYEIHHATSIRELVYQILLDWIQNKADEATVGILCTALWDAPEKDVVRRLAKREREN